MAARANEASRVPILQEHPVQGKAVHTCGFARCRCFARMCARAYVRVYANRLFSFTARGRRDVGACSCAMRTVTHIRL